MKPSVSISIFEALPNMPALFSRVTDHNLQMIKDLGYEGVDLFMDDPHSLETKEALQKLKVYQLGVGVVMPAALARKGLFLGSKDEAIRKEAIKQIQEIIQTTSECQGMVSLGLVRGNKEEKETMEEFLKRYLESCSELLKVSEPLGVPLVIEPINHLEINTINKVSECVEVIEKSGLPLYIMADTYHMFLEEEPMIETFKEALPLIKHIHFVDSNRLAPGMGISRLKEVYRFLKEVRYEGYLCLEVNPTFDNYIVAKEGSKFFEEMRNETI